MLNPRAFTFGGTSAIVTSMGLIIGLESATATTATIVSGLLIVAVTDNISDSLSIHITRKLRDWTSELRSGRPLQTSWRAF